MTEEDGEGRDDARAGLLRMSEGDAKSVGVGSGI